MSAQAADVTGANLIITGTADIGGDTLLLGTPTGISGAGLTLNYVDGSVGSVPDQLQFAAIRPTTSWLWLYTAAGGVLKPQMWLDDTNTLTLYDRAATPVAGIQLIPTGTSIFKNSLTVNGTDNRLPNQTLNAAGSIITEGLGDARYVRSGSAGLVIGTVGGDFTLAFPGGTATGVGSFAGIGASATGDYSSAGGYQSVASGYAANAAGFASHAEGVYSSALGYGAYGVGYFSSALGVYTHAYGTGSTASGYNATADGDWATAAGAFTEAAGQFQTVVGAYNLPQGDPSNWIATDDLFQIGNGTDSDHLSNALTVKKNGDTSVAGTLTASHIVGDVSLGARVDVASSATTPIGAASSNYVRITGTTAITGFDTVAAGSVRSILFDDSLILTQNATSLILPGGANIATAAGDTAVVVSEGSGNWRFLSYSRISGSSVVTAGITHVSFTSSGNFTVPPGITTLHVRGVGGGGSGSGSPSGVRTGGAAGAYGEAFLMTVTPGQIIPVTIGAGGAGLFTGGPGNAGGTTAFGSYLSLPGGAGGLANAAGTIVSSSADVFDFKSYSAVTSQATTTSAFGPSGLDSPMGKGGAGGSNAAPNGSNGTGYGAGGGGMFISGGATSSGSGSSGVIVVEY